MPAWLRRHRGLVPYLFLVPGGLWLIAFFVIPLITVASVAGMVAFPGRCAYTASKGAALQLAKSIAVDYAAAGIRSNAVCPGMVATPMTQWRLDIPELRAAVESRIPIGRVAQPDEIADAISVLASHRLGYLTGAAFVIDGGWTAL